MSLGRYLPTKGSALPFDPLSMGFNPGLNDAAGQANSPTGCWKRPAITPTRSSTCFRADFNLEIYDQLLAAV